MSTYRNGTIGGATYTGQAALRLLLCLLAVIVCLSGCTSPAQWRANGFKVGPEYHRAPAPVGDGWIDGDNSKVISSETDYSFWWTAFNDPMLDHLEAVAEAQNLSLKSAGMRILEARARLAVVRGNLWPQQQQAYGDYARIKMSETNAVPGVIGAFDFWDVGANLSWELDFWGRFRRAIESSEADLNAEIENYDDVLVILQAEVATAYIQLRSFEESLNLTKANVELQKRTLRLAEVRLKSGAVTELDVTQAKENLANTESLIPVQEQFIRTTQNALCVLLGVPPRDLEAELGESTIPEPPTDVVVGIPADLLRRRPDVRSAEREAASQSAKIGIAEADFYPRIAITGFIGLESANFSTLIDQRSWAGSIGPGFRWDILNYGRILNNVRAEEAKFYQLIVNYQNAALEANREVEDAITAFLKVQERIASLAEAVDAATRSVELADTQYGEGAVDFQRVVDSQRVLVSRQNALAQARGQVGVNLVTIYKAIGGGWSTRFHSQPTALADAGLAAPGGMPVLQELPSSVLGPEPKAEPDLLDLIKPPAP